MPQITTPVQIGELIKGGAQGRVHTISGEEIPPDSVVKVFQNHFKNTYHSRKEVEGFAAKYALVNKLLPDNSVVVHGVVPAEGGHGLVMERIPDPIRIYAVEHVTAQTVLDLKRIRDVLAENELALFDLQFTVDASGRVILFDLDNLYSWNPASPIYLPDFTREKGLEALNGRFNFYIEEARKDLANQGRQEWRPPMVRSVHPPHPRFQIAP